jgi:hypothetical protein
LLCVDRAAAAFSFSGKVFEPAFLALRRFALSLRHGFGVLGQCFDKKVNKAAPEFSHPTHIPDSSDDELRRGTVGSMRTGVQDRAR